MGTPFDDRLHEECGIFGVFDADDAAATTALGLHALQHRGQEAAGVVTTDGKHFYSHKVPGLVGDGFSSEKVIGKLLGRHALGHTRYATTGGTIMRNIQPIFADLSCGGFALAHNGNLTNAHQLRKALVRRGCIFQSTNDSESILHLTAVSQSVNLVDRLVEALGQVEGAYSLIALTSDSLIGVRDPLGVRPLILGRQGSSHILASESCALDIMGAEFVRDVKPGEMVVIDHSGVQALMPFEPSPTRFCVFEFIYFARPDSVIDGLSVYAVRKRIGAELAREAPLEADVVVPVPDSGVPAAIGFASELGVPFDLGIIRNHYIGRTFIEPTQQIRNLGVRLKHNANRALIEGKRVVLVDDSLVRGTTSIKIAEMIREAGAREVHFRISSPPITNPCYYGIDTPESDQLLAANMSVEEMAAHIGVESLAFISRQGLYRAVGNQVSADDNYGHCDACFSGVYPTALSDRDDGSPKQLSLLSEQD